MMPIKIKIIAWFPLFVIALSSAIYCQPQSYSFQYPTQSTQPLNCVFTFDSQTTSYDCISTNTTIKSIGAGFNSLIGNHVANHSNNNVNGLKISSQLCKYVPNNLGTLMPTLKKLEITYSGLLAIDYDDTYKLPHLQYLNLKGNRLVQLPGLLFHQNPELISIDFSDNFIKFISPVLLTDLYGLKFIDFSNNICVENSHPIDNFREWERELRRNCEPADKYYGIMEPLVKIADTLGRMNFYGNSG